MKNIGKVFLSDFKRISSNVVAIVIIMGLSIIPALYAWFNILSNWNPYGEEATSQMKIGVFSEDKGFSYEKLELNVGNTVVDGLKENSTIGWVFTDTKEETLEGVYSGEFYAALIIPEDFTEDMLSFIGQNLENPKIEYYENSKKNAIATKITSKAKSAVQQQVNTAFISTLAEYVASASEAITGAEGDGESLTDKTLTRLEEMDTTLETYENILTTFSIVTDSATDLVGSTQALLPNLNNMVKGSQNSVNNMQNSVLAGAQTADTIASMMDISMDSVVSGLESLNKQIQNFGLGDSTADITAQLEKNQEIINAVIKVVTPYVEEGNQNVQDFLDQNEALNEKVTKLTESQATSAEEMQELQKSISGEVSACIESMKKVRTDFDYNISPQLNQSVDNVQSALIKTGTLLNGIDGSFSDVDKALETYQNTLNSGTDNITATRDFISDIRESLGKVIEGLRSLSEDEQYQEIIDMMKKDPTIISTFIASPVVLDTEAIYEIKTYGSAMAPFYTVLALWVGALILVALVHVKVEREDELADIKPYQAYFGRYITFFIVSQIQALITVLGNLFFVQIQCVHPVLFYLAAFCSSFTFSILMYSLTVAFGNVGEAIAVVIMVIQVAGAGGTFPIEVLPKVYQAVYKFLPFTYCMNAMRECVGGTYRLDYLKDIGILGIFVIVSLIIGLVVEIPFRGMNEKIEKSKERSKVMM